MTSLISLLLSLFCFISPLMGQEELSEPVPTHAVPLPHSQELKVEGDRGDHFFSEFLNMLGMLGIVLLVLLILARLSRRALDSRMEQLNQSSSIKIVEKRMLAPKVTVYILEVQGKRLIVGETPTGLTRLGEF